MNELQACEGKEWNIWVKYASVAVNGITSSIIVSAIVSLFMLGSCYVLITIVTHLDGIILSFWFSYCKVT